MIGVVVMSVAVDAVMLIDVVPAGAGAVAKVMGFGDGGVLSAEAQAGPVMVSVNGPVFELA